MAKSKPDPKPAPAPKPETPPVPEKPAPAPVAPAEPAPPPVEKVSAAELTAGVVMPAPSDRAIAAIAADDAAKANPPGAPAPSPAPAITTAGTGPSPGELDSTNRAFDPAKFFPRKDTLGRWVNRGAGRKPGGSNPPAPSAPPVSSVVGDISGQTPGTPARDRYDLAAEAYCRTGYVLLDNIFQGGGEWQPENDSEHEGMRAAVANFLRSIGAVDLPPGLSLALVVATYSLSRFQKPNTKKRAKELVTIVREKISGRKVEEIAPGVTPLSPSPIAPVKSP